MQGIVQEGFPEKTGGMLFDWVTGSGLWDAGGREGAGIVQLPCPESTCLGMNRWGMSRDQYDHPSYRSHCRRPLLLPTVDQLAGFARAGYEIIGVIGVDGSASCGVTLTPVGFTGGVPPPRGQSLWEGKVCER